MSASSKKGPRANYEALGRNFAQFHANHRDVYRVMLDLAKQYRMTFPGQPVGMDIVMGAVRWHYIFEGPELGDDESYKMNSNLGAYYARLLMHDNEDLRGLFRLRRSVADYFDYVSMRPLTEAEADGYRPVRYTDEGDTYYLSDDEVE